LFAKPDTVPQSPNFSSGPTKKFPGYDIQNLNGSLLGRSHRAKAPLARINRAVEEQRQILGIPDDYHIGIVPASDTGAVEMAMWNLLGPRPVDICYWDAFGKDWYNDAVNELKLENVREIKADYGQLPDLSQTNPAHDILFTWNGTTSGVRVPNADWISADREGLTICDATSAIFSMDLPFDKLDVTTYSWQKALGSEAAHGMMILSPRAVERLESFKPDRPMPKIFRLTSKGKFSKGIFQGKVINTISMLAIEDVLGALKFCKAKGGLSGLVAQTDANLAAVADFVEATPWASFLCQDPANISSTSVCLSIDLEPAQVKQMASLLEAEGVAYDIGSYRDAPPGLRIWCGATVETADVKALMGWLDWAYGEVTK